MFQSADNLVESSLISSANSHEVKDYQVPSTVSSDVTRFTAFKIPPISTYAEATNVYISMFLIVLSRF